MAERPTLTPPAPDGYALFLAAHELAPIEKLRRPSGRTLRKAKSTNLLSAKHGGQRATPGAKPKPPKKSSGSGRRPWAH